MMNIKVYKQVENKINLLQVFIKLAMSLFLSSVLNVRYEIPSAFLGFLSTGNAPRSYVSFDVDLTPVVSVLYLIRAD